MNITRRILLIHTAGPLSGIRQIVGTTDTLGELPEVLSPIFIDPDERRASARRLKSTNRYVIYVEAAAAPQEGAA